MTQGCGYQVSADVASLVESRPDDFWPRTGFEGGASKKVVVIVPADVDLGTVVYVKSNKPKAVSTSKHVGDARHVASKRPKSAVSNFAAAVAGLKKLDCKRSGSEAEFLRRLGTTLRACEHAAAAVGAKEGNVDQLTSIIDAIANRNFPERHKYAATVDQIFAILNVKKAMATVPE